jgi:hypothetical protein
VVTVTKAVIPGKFFLNQKLTKRTMVVCYFVSRPQFVKVMILWVRYSSPAGFCKFMRIVNRSCLASTTVVNVHHSTRKCYMKMKCGF